MTAPYPLVPLGEVLDRSDEWTAIDPTAKYREVTVRMWGQGVVERRLANGSEIAAPRRLVARSGQFILSRIDARNGAFGLVPPSLDGAVVSNDFPVYDVRAERLLPLYLAWLSKTADFVAICRLASEGTTNRVRLDERRFLATGIPLPPLAEQRRIVARIEALAGKIVEAQRLRAEAAAEAEAAGRGVAGRAYDEAVAVHGSKPLAQLCLSVTDGDHQTPAFSSDGIKFIFVGNVSTGRLHFHGTKFVSRSYFDSIQPYRRPQRGDVLYSAVGATLGVPALVDTDEPFCFQRHVALIRPDPAFLIAPFLVHMLRSPVLFRLAWSWTTGSAQPTVPLGAIRELPIPVPSVPEQRRIVEYLDGLQARVEAVKRLQAETAAELGALLPAVLARAFRGEL